MDLTLAKETIHKTVLDQLVHQDNFDLDEIIKNSINDTFPLISNNETSELHEIVLREVSGFSFLEPYLRDPEVSEIMINSPLSGYIEKNGELLPLTFNSSKEDLIRLIQKIISHSGSKFDQMNPIVDAWLDDGSRVNAVMPPISAKGPYITIRKFTNTQIGIEDFCETPKEINALRSAIENQKNIVFAGATSSGKTTLLNACLNYVDPKQRIVSIEETSELKVEHPHHIKLLAKSANSEGVGQVSVADLVKTSLRMRPDRIVIGEVRSAEAFDLIQAMNTGHAGSMCTIHANGPREVLQRLSSLAMFAHKGLDIKPLYDQVVYGIDVIVFVERDSQKKRRLKEIFNVEKVGVRNV